MPEVNVQKGEPVDRALKRLKNKLEMEGVLEEMRRLRAFETPTQKTQRKARANDKRAKFRLRFNPNLKDEADEKEEATSSADTKAKAETKAKEVA